MAPARACSVPSSCRPRSRCSTTTLPVPTKAPTVGQHTDDGAARRARLRRRSHRASCGQPARSADLLHVFELTDEQQALDDAVGRLLAKSSSPEQVREAEAADPAGFSPAVWQGLVDMGLLDAAASGAASLADLAVVCMRAGAHLAPVPLAEALVAARATGAAEQGRIVVFAPLGTDGVVAPLVPGGTVADQILTRVGDRLVAGDVASVRSRRTLAGVATGDVTMGDPHILDRATPGRCLDEWRVLTAGGLAGLARAALDLGVAYAKDRHQFGVPIGSFQTIQHRFADLHTAVDGARLLAYEAAVGPRRPTIPTARRWRPWRSGGAAQVADEARRRQPARPRRLRLHARVRRPALRAAGQGVATRCSAIPHERANRARWDRAGASGRDRSPRAGHRLPLDPETEAFRAEVRAFLAEHLDRRDRRARPRHRHDARLGLPPGAVRRAGYLAAGWPMEVGGRGRSAVEMTALMQELYGAGRARRRHGHRVDGGATLVLRGTTSSSARRSSPASSPARCLCCLGYSEPDAGSDVAAVQPPRRCATATSG